MSRVSEEESKKNNVITDDNFDIISLAPLSDSLDEETHLKETCDDGTSGSDDAEDLKNK